MTPLVLICGLLGSGKTTFLHQLIPLLQKGDLVPHLIINDYVNATIDASLFRDLGTAVHAISGSCVCCDSQEELIDAMAEMRLQKRNILLIETNGTTDAELLIEQLTLDVRLRHFSLPITVAVVDAKHWQKRPWNRLLEVSQIQTSNYLYVSRSDLVDARRLEALHSDLGKKRIQGLMITPETFIARLLNLIEGQDDGGMRTPVRLNED